MALDRNTNVVEINLLMISQRLYNILFSLIVQ